MWTVRLRGIPEDMNDLSVIIQGKVYSFNSFRDTHSSGSDGSSGYFNDVYTFDASSYRWDMLQTRSLHPDDEPIDISGRSVVAYGHCAYLWGGRHRSPAVRGLFRFDTQTMTWSRPSVTGAVPKADVYHSACVFGNLMYTFGGLHASVGYVRFLDLDTFEWHCVLTSGVAPTARCCHTASVIGTRMYIWGGCDYDSQSDIGNDSDLYYLEMTTASWVRPDVQGNAPEGRKSHAAFVYDGELYIFGGSRETPDAYFSDMHKYDPQTSCWAVVTPSGVGPSARRSPGSTILGERVFVFGGFGPPLYRMDEDHIEEDIDDLEELTDFYVLHLAPTLQHLCLLVVIDARLDVKKLPKFNKKKLKMWTSSQS
ncbi:hypothetical protein V5799_010217 [Amblyomma americanum]|uniref:Kelch repeat protein n=1 Tax=Amblyomma americanum TaxID=6943 RepID=A0AAQ4F8B3_AMBAM